MESPEEDSVGGDSEVTEERGGDPEVTGEGGGDPEVTEEGGGDLAVTEEYGAQDQVHQLHKVPPFISYKDEIYIRAGLGTNSSP